MESSWSERRVPRRDVLRTAGAVAAGAVLGPRLLRSPLARAFGAPGAPLGPGSLPHPKLPEGTDALPQIEHIIVVMMENHSFDNYFGMLGRGDGFRLDKKGQPRNANSDANGAPVRAFHMPSTCQLDHEPNNSWNEALISQNGGKNDGFVLGSGPVAMGYWTKDDLPYYYALGRTFPLADRWFASVPAKTFPNRRFLIAGTAHGHLINDINGNEPAPNGTIFDRLDAHGITWRDYYTGLPTAGLYAGTSPPKPDQIVKIDQYFVDAANGTLPGFCLAEPDFEVASEENPQDIRVGEQFAAKVINAAMEGPAWEKTMIVWCYDEHGGYYDHVPSPRAVKPDAIPPTLQATDTPGAYDRYGVRVPALVISPRAKKNYVSHTVYDHTSILKLVETKWNLPAITNRDAHAADLLDCLDLHGKPAFREPPRLPKASLDANPAACPAISPESIATLTGGAQLATPAG